MNDITAYDEFSDEQIYHGILRLHPEIFEAFEKQSLMVVAMGWTEDQVMDKLREDPDLGSQLKEQDGFLDKLFTRAFRHSVVIARRRQLCAKQN